MKKIILIITFIAIALFLWTFVQEFLRNEKLNHGMGAIPSKLTPTPEINSIYIPISDQKTENLLTAVFKNQYYQKVINRTANENKDCSFYPVSGNNYQWIVENKLAFSGYSFFIGKNCNYGKAGDPAPFEGSFVFFVKTNTSWKAIDTALDYPLVCSIFDKKYYQFDIVGNLGCK